MSERRFWFVIDKGKLEYVQDNVTGENITVTELEDLSNEQQATIIKLRNENIILKNKIKDLRVSLFMQDKELQRQMQKSDLDE